MAPQPARAIWKFWSTAVTWPATSASWATSVFWLRSFLTRPPFIPSTWNSTAKQLQVGNTCSYIVPCSPLMIFFQWKSRRHQRPRCLPNNRHLEQKITTKINKNSQNKTWKNMSPVWIERKILDAFLRPAIFISICGRVSACNLFSIFITFSSKGGLSFPAQSYFTSLERACVTSFVK